MCRCQLLAEELAQTRQELESVDRQLQCAAKQKFMLQEKLCHYEVCAYTLILIYICNKLSLHAIDITLLHDFCI